MIRPTQWRAVQGVTRRCEHGSIVLTSDRPFTQWPTALAGDRMLAATVFDGLLYSAHIVQVIGTATAQRNAQGRITPGSPAVLNTVPPWGSFTSALTMKGVFRYCSHLVDSP